MCASKKRSLAWRVVALASGAAALVSPSKSARTVTTKRATTTMLAVPPGLEHASTTLFHQHVLPTLLTADAAVVAEEAAAKSDWFDPIVKGTEGAITMLHGLLGAGSYGVAIITFTILVKVLTFPLNYAQIESTTKMQALSPAVKRIQASYANDPQQMNMMLAQLYQENDLNPLAGCLPALVQIPIFIALYRALFQLAKENVLQESFLWLPSLEGPVFGAQNADWLFKFEDWNGFTPPLGWHDTLAYLSLPVLLVIAQSISGRILQPPSAGNQNNALLTVLPFMVGFFALNVPCSLSLYWMVNNIFTTSATILIRNQVMAGSGGVTMGGEAVVDVTAEPVSSPPPPKKKRKPKKVQPPPQLYTAVDTTEDAVTAVQAEDDEAPVAAPASKTAAKKLQKAAKTRRAKKSRRRD